jgi:hypothetical protein
LVQGGVKKAEEKAKEDAKRKDNDIDKEKRKQLRDKRRKEGRERYGLQNMPEDLIDAKKKERKNNLKNLENMSPDQYHVILSTQNKGRTQPNDDLRDDMLEGGISTFEQIRE